MSFVFCVFLATVYLFSAGITAKSVSGELDGGPAGPLDLSELIARGEASEARAQSAVDPALFAGARSHAAFITTNNTNSWHTFFWFFPVENKPLDSTPWIIWLQGGPGASSLYGLFTEIGPLTSTDGKVSRMPVTWGSNYSLLFIDNPVGVGFSYTEGPYMQDEDDVGGSLLSFIEQFLQVFPELQKAPLFIVGESYAGKYVPAFGHYVHHRQNKSIPINLKALVLADGYTDPPSLLHYSELAQQLGFMSPDEAADIKTHEDAARKAWKEGRTRDFLNELEITEAEAFSYVPNVYNYLKNRDYENYPFVPYLTRNDVRSALHTGNIKYQAFNWVVNENFPDLKYVTVKPWLEELLEHYKVLCYNGQLDFIVGYALSEHLYYSLKWSGAEAYRQAPRTEIRTDYPGQTLDIIGYMKGAGNFLEVMVRGAGHMAPADQPRAAKQIIDTFIHRVLTDQDLTTG